MLTISLINKHVLKTALDYALCISRFSISGAHAHWVGSLDTPSHATKGKKCANGTGSLITLLLDF